MGTAMITALKAVRSGITIFFFAEMAMDMAAIPPFAAILGGLAFSVALDSAIEILEGIR